MVRFSVPSLLVPIIILFAFQSPNTVDGQSSCSTYSSCGTCTATADCGWCSQSTGAATNCQQSSTGTKPSSTCSASASWSWSTSQCPVDACSTYSSCTSCASQTACGWCSAPSGSSTNCQTSGSGGTKPGTATCQSAATWSFSTSACSTSVFNCTSVKDCATCTGHMECGWCKPGTGNKSGCTAGVATGPILGNCSWVWDDSKCSPTVVDPCPSRTTCLDCHNAPKNASCGWCGSSNSCRKGLTYSGPIEGSCNGWYPDSTQCPAVDACNQFKNCTSCQATTEICGWCASLKLCMRDDTQLQSYGSPICPSGSFYSHGKSCTNSSLPCSAHHGCSVCTKQVNCGWCDDSDNHGCVSGDWNGPSSSYCSGYYSYVTSDTKPCLIRCTDAGSSCIDCLGKDKCEWCASTATCIDGTETTAFKGSVCPELDYSDSRGICTDAELGSKWTVSTSSSIHDYPGKGIAAWLLAFVVAGGVFILFVLLAVGGFAPKIGLMAEAPVHNIWKVRLRDTNVIGAGMLIHLITFAFLLLVAATDTWTVVSLPGDRRRLFGLIGVREEDSSHLAVYTCAGLTSENKKSLCINFLVGAIMTFVFQVGALGFTLVSLIYLFEFRRTGIWSLRVWTFISLGTLMSCSAWVCWAATSHLCLQSIFAITDDSPDVGTSWIEMFIAFILLFGLSRFWHTIMQYARKPAGAIPGGHPVPPSIQLGNNGMQLYPAPSPSSQQPGSNQPVMLHLEGQPNPAFSQFPPSAPYMSGFEGGALPVPPPGYLLVPISAAQQYHWMYQDQASGQLGEPDEPGMFIASNEEGSPPVRVVSPREQQVGVAGVAAAPIVARDANDQGPGDGRGAVDAAVGGVGVEDVAVYDAPDAAAAPGPPGEIEPIVEPIVEEHKQVERAHVVPSQLPLGPLPMQIENPNSQDQSPPVVPEEHEPQRNHQDDGQPEIGSGQMN